MKHVNITTTDQDLSFSEALNLAGREAEIGDTVSIDRGPPILWTEEFDKIVREKPKGQ